MYRLPHHEDRRYSQFYRRDACSFLQRQEHVQQSRNLWELRNLPPQSVYSRGHEPPDGARHARRIATLRKRQREGDWIERDGSYL